MARSITRSLLWRFLTKFLYACLALPTVFAKLSQYIYEKTTRRKQKVERPMKTLSVSAEYTFSSDITCVKLLRVQILHCDEVCLTQCWGNVIVIIETYMVRANYKHSTV